MQLSFAATTDAGLVRANNEDCYVADPDLAFFVVADGMGGHSSGEIASSSVAEDVTAFIRETSRASENTWPFGLDPSLSALANRLQVAVRSANRRQAARVQHDASLDGSGATLVAALFGDDQVAISNVGDCRAYLARKGTFTQVTRDHSLVAEQVALGLIDSDEARRHPLRHVVTRAVSGDAAMLVDIWELAVQSGDRLLLCSDGIHGVLTDPEVAEYILERRASLDRICATLVDAVRRRGAPDNATAVVVEVV
jgi:protein phosphatase